jgi:hypothetical protein
MPINIANFYESDRRSATAGEAMVQGMVVKVSDTGTGTRELMKVANEDTALLVAGNYALVMKVSMDPAQVTSSTITSSPRVAGSGDIADGDAVIECRRGTIMEYSADLLDASLDPGRAGETPVAGQALGVVGAQFCKADAGSAIVSPVIGRVFQVFGTKVQVELV